MLSKLKVKNSEEKNEKFSLIFNLLNLNLLSIFFSTKERKFYFNLRNKINKIVRSISIIGSKLVKKIILPFVKKEKIPIKYVSNINEALSFTNQYID